MDCSAVIDETGHYRYTLTRRWGDGPSLCFVMLNPSTADGLTDDPTIRRCIGFARRWDYKALEVVNLYAFRSAHPEALWRYPLPVGPENDRYIREVVQRSSCVIAAWGAEAKDPIRVAAVVPLLRQAYCLGRTKKRAPRHPLFLPYDVGIRGYIRNGVLVE